MKELPDTANDYSACIYTLDYDAAAGMREFLSRYGCSVSVNNPTTRNPAYEIIIGDVPFVKSILAKRVRTPAKRLTVIWTAQPLKLLDIGDVDGKFIQMPARGMSRQEVNAALHFLFTSRSRQDMWIDVPPTVLALPTYIVQPDPSRDVPQYGKTEPHATPKEMMPPAIRIAREEVRAKPVAVVESPKPVLVPKTVPVPKPAASVPVPVSVQRPPRVEPAWKSQGQLRESSDRQRISRVIENVYKPAAPATKPPLRIPILHIVTALAVPLLLLIPYLVAPAIPLISAGRAVRCYRVGDIPCVGVQARAVEQSSSAALALLSAYRPLTATAFPRMHADLVLYLQWLHDMGALGADSASAADLLVELSASLISFGRTNEEISPVVAVDKLRGTIGTVGLRLSQATLATSALRTDAAYLLKIPVLSDTVTRADSLLNTARTGLTVVEQGISVFPKIGGFREPKHYLVLLQNTAELRPTGGFIGSYMKLTVDTGRIAERTIEDIYTADGQLKGHVDPPAPVRQLLGQEHWYMRDSNWNPDFRESGARALWFYEKETGSRADGVIAVNSSIIRSILSAIGPVDLDGSDRITADNFYEKAFAYTEKDFFPGSTQKKDFLGKLAEAIMMKADAGNGPMRQKIVGAILQALVHGDILVYVTDPDVQELVQQYGWSGKVPSVTGCQEKSSAAFGCGVLYAAVNEANVGMTKNSRKIDRRTVRTITVKEDGAVTETIARTLSNPQVGGEGTNPYTAYIRFLVPQNILGMELTVDGTAIPRRPEATSSAELPYWEYDPSTRDATGIAVAVSVPQGEQRTVALSYRWTSGLPFGTKGTLLEIVNQKQPGVDSASMLTSFVYPPAWNVSSMQLYKGAASLANPGRLEYNSDLSADDYIYLSIRKTL